MSHPARIFTDQVGFDFLDGFRAGPRTAFQYRLAQANDARVSVDLQKQPPGLDQKRFELCDFQESLSGREWRRRWR
jgi:hypothetical protein